MTLSKRYIGIDGGGTKTACVIGTTTGNVLAMATGESSNIQSKPLPEVAAVLTGLIEHVMNQSNSDFSQVEVIYMALAGSARKEDKEKIIRALRATIPDRVELVIDHDAKGALAAGTWGESGLVLIAGTGSIAYAFSSSHAEPTRVGGWGYMLGDEGSGFDIGKKGISAVLKEYDGRGAPTQMTGLLLDHLKRDNPGDMIPAIYGAPNVRSHIAGLARIVFTAAEKGDAVAVRILEEARDQLVLLVEGAYKRLPETAVHSLVVSGGLFQNTEFKETFEAAIQRRTEHLSLIYPALAPVIGSLILALKQTGIKLTDEMKTTLETDWAHLSKGDGDSSGDEEK